MLSFLELPHEQGLCEHSSALPYEMLKNESIKDTKTIVLPNVTKMATCTSDGPWGDFPVLLSMTWINRFNQQLDVGFGMA